MGTLATRQALDSRDARCSTLDMVRAGILSRGGLAVEPNVRMSNRFRHVRRNRRTDRYDDARSATRQQQVFPADRGVAFAADPLQLMPVPDHDMASDEVDGA